FGYWQDYINWQDAFRFPDRFLESRMSENDDLEFEVEYEFPKWLSELLNTAKLDEFSIADAYYRSVDEGKKGKVAVDLSMVNHAEVIAEATRDLEQAMEYIDHLQEHIEHR
ncbi:MAG: DEAD/DEAH box helicase, partial [Bacteroidota bacterium]